MSKGKLSNYFKGAAAKKLKQVDINPQKSNQHELNGVNSLKKILGESKLTDIPARAIYIDDNETGLTEEISLTWYDSRLNQPHRTAEYRLYYTENGIIPLMSVDDTVFVLLRQNDEIILVFVRDGSEIERKICWLFDIQIQNETRKIVFPLKDYDEKEVDFVVRYVLDEIGIETDEEGDVDLLDRILKPYGNQFPPTKVFSKLARQHLPEKVSSVEDPDSTLVKWFDFEDKLFRHMERKLISEVLQAGFVLENQEVDVDGFIRTSLSIHNRRKSRAGYAFEHHLEKIFLDNELKFVRPKKIEGNKKPDFLFPSVEAYNDKNFPSENLRILGAKTTAKDRWRQILSEGDRVSKKHFVTLEASISESQTDEMKGFDLQLVLPKPLFPTYSDKQQEWLITLAEFISEIKSLYNSSFRGDLFDEILGSPL